MDKSNYLAHKIAEGEYLENTFYSNLKKAIMDYNRVIGSITAINKEKPEIKGAIIRNKTKQPFNLTQDAQMEIEFPYTAKDEEKVVTRDLDGNFPMSALETLLLLNFVTVSDNRIHFPIPLGRREYKVNEILFIKSFSNRVKGESKNTTYIAFINGGIVRSNEPLKNFEKALEGFNNFIVAKRGLIINREYFVGIEMNDTILLELPEKWEELYKNGNEDKEVEQFRNYRLSLGFSINESEFNEHEAKWMTQKYVQFKLSPSVLKELRKILR